MDAITWLDRQQELADEGPASGAGAALPLVLWAIVLLGSGAATALRHMPFWSYALLVASPAILLAIWLALRPAISALVARPLRRRTC